MDVIIRLMAAIIIAFGAMTSSGVLQPGSGDEPAIHVPHPSLGASGNVKGVEAFRGTPRPDATAAPTPSAKPSEGPSSPVKKAGPRPASPSPVRTAKTFGSATWYCCTRGHSSAEYVAAAGPALRVGHWRGRTVTVCVSRCLRVRLVDWCGCPGHVIDLHPSAFRALAPLSRGVVRVNVSW